MRRLVALILFLLTALAVGCGSQLAAAGPIGTFSRGYSGVAAPGYVYDVALKQSIQTVGIAEDSPPPAPPPTSTRGGALPRIHFHAVAAEAGAGSGDGIVLGLRNQGLEQTATKVGGRTLLNDSDWQATLQKAIANPSTKFTVSLDGMSGSSTYGQIMSAAQRGAAGVGGYTDWEMAQLYGAGRLPGVTFVRGGAVVPNPFG
jgi:hypothetical protein